MRKMLLATAIAVAFAGPTKAASECRDSVDSFNSAVGEISYTLKRYARCVEGSGGNDDCSSEFRRLKNAQYDFEMAVSNYRSECE